MSIRFFFILVGRIHFKSRMILLSTYCYLKIWISNMGSLAILLALFHLSGAEVVIRNEETTFRTSYMLCYQDAKTEEFERLIFPVNPFTELEPDHFYKFSLEGEGKEESRYIRLLEGGKGEVFNEDGEKMFLRTEKCECINLFSKTFTSSEDSFNADEEFLKFISPSDDWTSEETWLLMEACLCLIWTILLFFYEQWTNILGSKTRSVEISRGTYSRKFGKMPRRYIS